MSNAKTASVREGNRILILGSTGSGKTTQFLTLPGKKFMYLFDPNAINSIVGFDVDYLEFLPDRLNLKLTSLSKDHKRLVAKEISDAAVKAYGDWEKDFEDKLRDNFFDSYSAIAFDSFTTLSDMVMDGVLAVNGRAGQYPQQDDYPAQMLTLTNIVRTATALDKTCYWTGHVELKQDELTHTPYQTPLMTGRLKVKLPLLFSEILYMEARINVSPGSAGSVQYVVQTKPNRRNPLIRCTMRNLQPFEDVTLDFNKPLERQGLGRFLSGA